MLLIEWGWFGAYIKNHLIWFLPFIKILKLHIGTDEYSRFRGDKTISDTLISLKKNPLIVNHEQRALIGLIEPDLEISVKPLNLEVPDSRGPVFPLSIFQQSNTTENVVLPPDLSIAHAYMKSHKLDKRIKGRYSDNIINVLRHIRDNEGFIPFPNMTILGADKKYFIEYSECDDILPHWREQLINLRQDFRTQKYE